MTGVWAPYCGVAPVPAELLSRWNFDPVLLVPLAAGGVWLLLRARSTPRAVFVIALAVLLFVSPFCALTSALFSARVAHHVLLTAMAAPLLVWALPLRRPPGPAMLWAVLHAALFWLWHAPAPYAAALSGDALYWLMQASLFGSAVLLWAAIRAAPAPLAIGMLLVTMVQMGMLGALITFAGAPLYAPHWASALVWDLRPIEDQQLAGLIMWVPGSLVYLAAALRLGWFALDERRPVPA